MPFEKGKSGNPEGRPPGIKSKATTAVKELVESMITDNVVSIKAEFATLKGEKKIKAFIDLLPYLVPRLQSTSLDIELERLSDEQVDELYNRILNSL
jgi:hypothetical protein